MTIFKLNHNLRKFRYDKKNRDNLISYLPRDQRPRSFALITMVSICLVFLLIGCDSEGNSKKDEVVKNPTFNDIVKTYAMDKFATRQFAEYDTLINIPVDSLFIMLGSLFIQQDTFEVRLDSVENMTLPKGEFEKTKDWQARIEEGKRVVKHFYRRQNRNRYEQLIGVALPSDGFVYSYNGPGKIGYNLTEGSVVTCTCKVSPDVFSYNPDNEILRLTTESVEFLADEAKIPACGMPFKKYDDSRSPLVSYIQQGEVRPALTKQTKPQGTVYLAYFELKGGQISPDDARSLKDYFEKEPITCEISAYVAYNDSTDFPEFEFFAVSFKNKNDGEIMRWTTKMDRIHTLGWNYWRELIIEIKLDK